MAAVTERRARAAAVTDRPSAAPLPLRAVALGIGAALVALGGCAPSVPPLPLRPEPVPYADTLPIEEPERRTPVGAAVYFEEAIIDEAGRPFRPRRWLGRGHEALNLTRADDVVPSAWFEPRNGRPPMTPQEVGRGAAAEPGPDTSRALTIVEGKAEGVMPGFTVRDARGDRYLFKFDPRGHPYVASAADVIASRLFWAAGYHVPADYMVTFDRDRLVLEPGAEVTVGGRERLMTEEDIRAILAAANRREDGLHVALASRLVPGTPKGPFRFEGRRPDDPNDHYAHQHRRELRGLYVLSAWLNHVDMRFENTLDAWIDPPGYLRHYLIDFASALGSGGLHPHYPREGSEYNFDLWPTLGRLFTLGFFRLGWEDLPTGEIHPHLGWLPVESFDPGGWKPNWPNAAFDALTPADGYWGAKLVGSFTDEHLRAAVDAAGLPDPVAADTLVDILAYRRDRTVEHWFARVTPVERPRARLAEGRRGLLLEFEDLALARGVAEAEGRRYAWELWRGARVVDRGEDRARPGARQRIVVGTGAVREGELLELRLRTLSGRARPARVWLRGEGAAGAVRVVGLLH